MDLLVVNIPDFMIYFMFVLVTYFAMYGMNRSVPRQVWFEGLFFAA
jgi:hypothetical protein